MSSIGDASLRRALLAIEQSTSGMSPEDMSWSPEGKWSTAQVLEHLARAYATTAYILNKCADERRTVARTPSLGQRLFIVMVVTLGYLPRGVKAPAVTVPHGMTPSEALDQARTSLEALDRAASRTAACFGPATRVANHPLLGGFTTAQWRRFHWVHTRHHIKQIAALQRARTS